MKDWSANLTQADEEKARRFRAEGWWRDERLCDLLAQRAAERPDHPAVADPRGTVSYGELAAVVDALAAGLVARGVEPGDVVTFQLPNWRETIALTAACTRIGAVFNSIAPIFRERDLRVMLGLAAPKVVVVPREFRGFDHAALALALAGELPQRPVVAVVAGEAPGGAEPFDALLGSADALAGVPRPAADSCAQLAFTSGTTGEPKGVLHTHETVLCSTRLYVERFGLHAGDVFHMASTLGHQTGVLFGVQMPLMTGATVVLQEAWDADEFVRLIERHGITMTNGAIPFLADFISSPEIERRDISSLRLFGCFGAGLPRPIARRAAERAPGCRVFGGWGMTETGLAVTNLPDDGLDLVCDTDGIPCPGTEIRILDESLSHEVEAGVEGELVTRGPMRHLGFLQPSLSERYFLEGDWYVTGDRGLVRPDGNFMMTARTKDIIVRGGENIPVMEVENTLLEHPAVAACAVVAVPDDRLGERACACVVPAADASGGRVTFSLEEMREWCDRQRLTRQYWPERLELFTELPTTASGKVQKFRLRELVRDRPEDAVAASRTPQRAARGDAGPATAPA